MKKLCTKCGIEKSLEKFHKKKSSKDGLRSCCKECRKKDDFKNKDIISEKNKIHYIRNREAILKNAKTYYFENKDKCVEYKKIWRSKNRNRLLKDKKKYYLDNKSSILNQQKDYYLDNKDVISERSKIYREKNKDVISERSKKYYKNNKEQILEKNVKYRRTPEGKAAKIRASHKRRSLKSAGGSYTDAEWKEVLEKYGEFCLHCGSTEHITIDHVIALSQGGSNTKNNLQPLCMSCNCSKGIKAIDYRI